MEDLFEEFDGNDDLISSEPRAKASTSTSTAASTSTLASQNAKTSGRKLTPAQRLERMERIIAFIQPRLGRKPTVNTPPARNSAWIQLFDLATSEEQLKRVVDLLPGWKDSGREVTDQISEHFVGAQLYFSHTSRLNRTFCRTMRTTLLFPSRRPGLW